MGVQCRCIFKRTYTCIHVIFLYLASLDMFGAGASFLLLGPPGSNWCFSFAPELVSYSASRDLHRRVCSESVESVESSFLIHQDIYHDSSVCS